MDTLKIIIICISVVAILVMAVIFMYKIRNSKKAYQPVEPTPVESSSSVSSIQSTSSSVSRRQSRRQSTSSKSYGPLGKSTMLATTRSYKPPKFKPEISLPPIPGSTGSSASETPPETKAVSPPLPDEPPPNIGKSYPIDSPQRQPSSRTSTPKGSPSL